MVILLPIHILAGSIALLSAIIAMASQKGQELHLRAGKTYFWCMVAIFITAIPMSVITSNIFLFLIAIFSFYLAFAGVRFAKNRKGIATVIDWIAIGLMVLSGLGMLVLAGNYYINDNAQYITLIVFGVLSLSLGYTDFRNYMDKTATGKRRLARHLTNMMGGTIAVITAVLVVNAPFEPVWIWWVLPTAVITPVIIRWNAKVMR